MAPAPVASRHPVGKYERVSQSSCEGRRRESLLFDRLLVLCREQGFLAQHGRQRTDSTHVLGAVRTVTRLACAIETLRTALDALAVAAPNWLRAHADKAWAERYERRGGDVDIPKGEAARRAFAETVGRDGEALLNAVTGPGAPAWLREVPAVEILRRAWVQNSCRLDDDAGPSEPDKPQILRWRTEVEGYPPSALMVASPHGLDVHYAKKRQTTWIGYKVHLTDTCESGQPNLITHVETTTAPVVDRDVLADVHAALKGKDLRPERHLVDAGYIDADGLVASARDHGITFVGPPPADNQWQARTEGAFAIEQFDLDWDRQIATCPAGQTSESWIPDTNGGHDNVRIRFSLTHCKACPLKARCTRSNRRVLAPRRRQEHETLVAARTAAKDPAFIAERKRRAGIEGTLSKAVRTNGLRRSAAASGGRRLSARNAALSMSTSTWCRSAVNRSVFPCLAACRTRPSACVTRARPWVRSVLCRFAFPLVPGLGSTGSAPGCPAFVRRLHSYYAGIRLLPIVHRRLRLLAFPPRTE